MQSATQDHPKRIKLILAAGALAALASPALADRLLLARGHWAAFAAAGSCRAVSEPEIRARKGQPPAYAAFAFDRARRGRTGELYLRMRRPVRPGAGVLLTVGRTPFLLANRGGEAWSRNPGQALAIIAAVRSAGEMRAVSSDQSGRRFSDRYLLAGAPSAIDAAAAACA